MVNDMTSHNGGERNVKVSVAEAQEDGVEMKRRARVLVKRKRWGSFMDPIAGN